MSIAICVLMITSISAPITQNAGQPENDGQLEIDGQPQNLLQSGPSPTSGGSGGLADSPWPMFRQNLNHTGQSPYDTSGNNGQLKWSFTTDDKLFSSPAIGTDGTIYVGSRDYKLYAINPDGSEKWNFTTDERLFSSPAIGSDGTIYIGSLDNKLYAINPDGSEKWNFTTGGWVHSSPAIGSDGTIYVGSADDKLYAIKPDGIEKWNFTATADLDSSPTIGSDGTIYIGSEDNNLYAINPDGTKKWSFITGSMVYSSSAIGSDGTIYVGCWMDDHKLYAINPDGTEKWNFTTDAKLFSSPAIGSDGTIYVGSSDHKLYAIKPDGTEKWSFKTNQDVYSSPAIGSDGTIYFGSFDHKFYAVNPDGTEKWNFTTGNWVQSSPAIGFDGTIYIGSNDHNLYAIGNPSPNLEVSVISHFTSLNSAAQSAITVHVTDGTNPVQGATVTLSSDNGGIFSPQSGITDSNGDFKSIFNAPTVTSHIICRISAEASKIGYNNGSNYMDVTINPIPWPMFSYNSRHTALSPYDTSSNPGNLKWSFPTDGLVESSSVIGADGTIYIGSQDNKLYAINPDGSEKWNFTAASHIASIPAIDSDGTIYFGSHDHKLYAINSDGTKKWDYMTGGKIRRLSPSIGADGTIYICSDDSNFYAISSDGTKKWSYSIGYYGYSSPAIGVDGTIIIGSFSSYLYAYNQDGTQKWTFKTKQAIHSSPTIGSNGIIYIGSDDNNLYAINPDGTKKWNFTTGDNIDSAPAIGSDGTIYVGSQDNKLYAINSDGSEKWSFNTEGSIHSSPAISADGTIFIGSNDYKLYAINPDGSERWNFTTDDGIESSPAIGSDGTIYIGCHDTKLYAIGAPIPDITVEKTANVTTAKPGNLIEYTIYYNNTATVTETPTGPQQLTFEDFNQYTADISVDGTQILYSARIGYDDNIWIMDIDGTNHQQLTFENYLQREPSYSPDGTEIVYSSTEDGGVYEDIWVMDSDGGNHVQLTSNYESQRYPKFSPDGSKIIYASKEDGSIRYYDIWIMDSDGSNKQQLTFEDNAQTNPVFSPDGMKIAYQSWEAGDSFSNIWIMDSDGSNHQQLTFEKNSATPPRFSPNGNWIVYTFFNKIYIVDINGNNKQLIDDTQNAKGWVLFDRSGNKLYYSAYDIGGGYLDIWTLDLEPSNGSAHTVWINDTLPPGTTFITSSAEANRTGDYNWTFYNVEPGEHNFTITVEVNSSVLNGTILTNYVHLDYTNFEDIQMPSSWDSVDVLVLAPENLPPIADTGPDQTINEGDVVQFNGSASYDPYGYVQEILSESQPNITYPYPWGWTGISFNAELNASQGVLFDSEGNLSRIDIYINIRDNLESDISYNVVLSFTDELENLLGTSSQKVDHFDKWYIFRFSEPIYIVAECLYFISIEAPDQDAYPMWFAIALLGIDPYPKAHGYLNGTIIDDFSFKTYLAGNKAQSLKYEWDFDVGNGLWWETGATPDATDPNPTHTYGDDGVFVVTLRVTDNNNLSATDTCNITVQNVNPTVSIESITMDVEIGLRVAGRKYNNVSMTLYEEGSSIGYVSIERLPGSPNEQMAWISVSINFSRSYNATVTYTPKDPPNIGGNPVWIYIKSKDGTLNEIHHTFNVQQSKDRNSTHWNHVEPWEVDLNAHFIGLPFEITSHVTDPGSDDEILTFTYGSQIVTVTNLNNPPNPDPYPSPEINPVGIMDTTTLVYEGPGTVTLVVKDDDNIRLGIGEGTDSIIVA